MTFKTGDVVGLRSGGPCCHCFSTLPLMVRVPRSLLNLCCLLGLVRSRGSRERASHASRTGSGA
jgi:hypothetical protein